MEAGDIDEPAMADEMPEGGRALFYPEIPWGAPPTWKGTFMRGVRFLQFWDVLTSIACLYVAWAVSTLPIPPLKHPLKIASTQSTGRETIRKQSTHKYCSHE